MKQTAVQWILDNLNTEPYSEADFKYNAKCWDKAKAMEKEQMIKFYADYSISLMYGDGLTPTEFYNQTFNKETK